MPMVHEKFEYDQDNNLVKMTDENGTVINFTYDALNRVTRKDITRASGLLGRRSRNSNMTVSRELQILDNNDPDDDTDDTVTCAYDSLGRAH